ncbi:3'-5' RNA helicase YTHDC2-like [Diorhabda carinulata]|uniref:3'-5' RNA helicase YTHDC2-like n=1 Tax=Diorhabda carinulata TaxID=1163345 RepID=UPI00259FE612|nr:3'-5' RNA helicase YTHDC2-like [Diorhabda carinulata]
MNNTVNKQKKFSFNSRHFRNKKSVEFDMNCLESTPEIMRIEIDRIFKEFVDNPDENEYVFSSDLNNLQRKYIHYKAQKMNIISKSYGKEPDRRLHIKKKSEQLSNQFFMITPSQTSQKFLHSFVDTAMPNPSDLQSTPSSYSVYKGTGRLLYSHVAVPTLGQPSEEIYNTRKDLPIYENKEMIMEAIKNHQIIVLASETGSGKTTQIPQYIIDEAAVMKKPCKVICTQPRRISTVAAAERVAFERGEGVGATVGYHIKLEQKYGLNTNVIFCTTGVFLRHLMGGTDSFKNITHIVIDEIHERDKLADFLLICIKQNIHHYPELKIILMSATINTNKFVEYFGNVKVLSIPGRLFEINTLFLEDVLANTKYMSDRMIKAQKNEQVFPLSQNCVYNVETDVEKKSVAHPHVDDALEEYLNFSDNYDYRLHYEEATAQLGMYFISEGISVDYQHSETGQTALMIAAHLADKEFISRLCNMGANLDVHCKLHKTVFDYANGNPDILRLLEYVKHKRSADIQDEDNSKEGERLLELYDRTTPDDMIDYALIVNLIQFIHYSRLEGSILVFLPGYDEIMLCNDGIVNSGLDSRSYRIFFLHGSMNIKDQNDVFMKLGNKRKIILSTNIAETSITIDDVVFVIDVGKAKEKCFDAYNKVSSLQTKWISQACANQRKGRAGRTRPGMCFRLYSKQRYDNMDVERIPEILRVSLEELCLHAKILAPDDMNINNFLSLAPDAPSANSIKVAIENLQFLGALDKEEDLTRLGAYLSQLTIEPQLGKMLIYGIIFRCLEPILTLVATLSHKDPFQLPPQANLKSVAASKRKNLINGVLSDHVLYLQVFKKWQEMSTSGNVTRFCEEYFVSNSTMNLILETRSQLLGQLRAIKFIPQNSNMDEFNKHANCWPMVKAIICTGSYPNLAYPCQNNLATRREKKVNIHLSSACANQQITTWLVYDEMVKHRNGLLIRGVSAVTTLTIGLVCGIDVVAPSMNVLNIDDWVDFEYPDHSVIYLRNALDLIVNKVMSTPWYVYSSFDQLAIKTLRNVLESEETYAQLRMPDNVGDRPKFFLPQKCIQRRSWRDNEPNRNPIRNQTGHCSSSYQSFHCNQNAPRGNQNQYRSEYGSYAGTTRRIPSEVGSSYWINRNKIDWRTKKK